MIDLNRVTIICIDGLNPNLGLKSILYSIKNINFKKNILISHTKPNNTPNNIDFVEKKSLTHETYSTFILYELYKYVETDFCLITHSDGFVINSHLWDDVFFNYDYIGAPWPKNSFYENSRVGNGGFSLRSKKFIELCRKIPCRDHEDAACCIYYKNFLEKNGCKYAPVEIAMRFSLESEIPECEYNLNNSFGFHGKGIVKSVHGNNGKQFVEKNNLLKDVI